MADGGKVTSDAPRAPRAAPHSDSTTTTLTTKMATPVLFGLGALAAGLAGRHFLRSSRGAAEQWVKGGFKAKMDRREAVAILGLKCVRFFVASLYGADIAYIEMVRLCRRG